LSKSSTLDVKLGAASPSSAARSFAAAVAAAIAAVVFSAVFQPTEARAVTIDLVPVRNAGNASDPATGNLYGAVNYEYGMAKHDVTIGQYTDFLNAVAKTDTYSLYNTAMGTDNEVSGITRSGVSGNYSYSVLAASGIAPYGGVSGPNRPITYVSWWDAARFANWLANGQPTGAQTSTTTENGAYNLNGATSGTAPARNVTNPNTGATPAFVIPTENEWYKAAYYSPVLNSGSGGYWTYATQSNTAPGNLPGSGANQANGRAPSTSVLSVTQAFNRVGGQNYLTDVGAFTNSPSYYGTFDQTGNVSQWNDFSGAASTNRGLRGGDYTLGQQGSFYNSNAASGFESAKNGFRVTSTVYVPEPSTLAMGAVGLVCGGWQLFRRRRAR
jgi:formylglycine-generating enzyme required for sulfatase activity